jgi:erythritol kinase
MTREIIIGLDAGTSVIKAVAFGCDGRQLGAAAAPNSIIRGPDGAAEQDMGRTWKDVCHVLRELVGAVPDLPARTAAIAVTGQGDGTWLVDGGGEPVAPAWVWLDSRAAALVEEFVRSGVAARTHAITGCGLNACQQGAQLAWLHRNRPEVLERAATAFHCKDWIYFRMTGRRATDVSEGIFTFGDFRTRAYAPEILDALGIAALARLLPEPVDGTAETDALTAEAAEATGLRAGTPVSLGFLDVLCTGLGGGLFEPGRNVGCSIIGSTGMHMRLFPRPEAVTLGEEPIGYTVPFPMPGHVVQMQSNMAATLNIDWIVRMGIEAAGMLGVEVSRHQALKTIDRQVLEARPGAVLYHPYIDEAGERGPFCDVHARAQLFGLCLGTGYLDLVRGVYEGLGFAARDCYAAMGHRPEEIRIAGGAARSRSLKTILASVLGIPIRESSQEEAGAAGAAMMAAVATGFYPDLAAACRTWVDPTLGATIDPDPPLVRLYDELFGLYRDLRTADRPHWRRLAAIRREFR